MRNFFLVVASVSGFLSALILVDCLAMKTVTPNSLLVFIPLSLISIVLTFHYHLRFRSRS
ncbi:MAG: hypothetical protein HQ591_09730 [candidate division Zixibacteria bacterium]|nr:hypothetical protein [Candidatus Tariuqbacter arcticus]